MVDQERVTDSGIEIQPVYEPEDDRPRARSWATPGSFPFTRGVYPDMYRKRLWTMRQYAGFGSAEETNERFRYLLEAGQTGLSVAFDLPTQMGYDSDHPKAQAEVGRVGVAIDSLADMELLLKDIPLGEVSTSMTINATASILLLLYELVAEKQGVPPEKITGTTQNDILKEYAARGTYIYPPKPSMRIITDLFAYCRDRLPRWNTISISGYHMREAGSTAVQEVAFTIADGIAYVEAAIDAGTRRRRVRSAALLLLRLPHELLRRGGEVQGRSAAVGESDEGAVRSEEPTFADASVPHPDRGSDPDRAAAREQHRQDRARGAGCGDGWDAVAPHQRLRRGAVAADPEGGDDRSSHAAGDRLRVGGRRTPPIRSAAPGSSSR